MHKLTKLSPDTFQETTLALASAGTTFTELSYLKETALSPSDTSRGIRQAEVFSHVIATRGLPSEIMSISVEAYRMFDNSVRPARVVVVNEKGERVLDTMIKVEDTMMVMVKPGKKAAILELA